MNLNNHRHCVAPPAKGTFFIVGLENMCVPTTVRNSFGPWGRKGFLNELVIRQNVTFQEEKLVRPYPKFVQKVLQLADIYLELKGNTF